MVVGGWLAGWRLLSWSFVNGSDENNNKMKPEMMIYIVGDGRQKQSIISISWLSTIWCQECPKSSDTRPFHLAVNICIWVEGRPDKGIVVGDRKVVGEWTDKWDTSTCTRISPCYNLIRPRVWQIPFSITSFRTSRMMTTERLDCVPWLLLLFFHIIFRLDEHFVFIYFDCR